MALLKRQLVLEGPQAMLCSLLAVVHLLPAVVLMDVRVGMRPGRQVLLRSVLACPVGVLYFRVLTLLG